MEHIYLCSPTASGQALDEQLSLSSISSCLSLLCSFNSHKIPPLASYIRSTARDTYRPVYRTSLALTLALVLNALASIHQALERFESTPDIISFEGGSA